MVVVITKWINLQEQYILPLIVNFQKMKLDVKTYIHQTIIE
jgi:hypothetical protein